MNWLSFIQNLSRKDNFYSEQGTFYSHLFQFVPDILTFVIIMSIWNQSCNRVNSKGYTSNLVLHFHKLEDSEEISLKQKVPSGKHCATFLTVVRSILPRFWHLTTSTPFNAETLLKLQNVQLIEDIFRIPSSVYIFSFMLKYLDFFVS